MILSISLLLRVLWQKRQMTRSLHWCKNRNMTIQSLSGSCLFFFGNIGSYTITIVQKISYTEFGSSVFAWTYLIAWCLLPLIPFICLACSPELWSKIVCVNVNRRNRLILPVTWTVTTQNTDRVAATIRIES